MNHIFNFKRFKNLFVRDVLVNLKPMSTIVGGIFFILLLISVLILLLSEKQNMLLHAEKFYKATYYIAFLFGALFISGNAFRDFRKKEKTMNYLMLPSSTSEKVLSQYLIVTLIFTAIVTVGYYLFSFLNVFMINVFTEGGVDLYEPFSKVEYVPFLRVFIPSQIILLAGAVTFKKSPLFFTGLTYFLFSLVSWIFIIATFTILFSNIDGGTIELAMKKLQLSEAFTPPKASSPMELFFLTSEHFKMWSLKVIYYFNQYVLSALLLVYIWFKVKEKQV